MFDRVSEINFFLPNAMLASTLNNVDVSWKKRKHEEVDVSEVSSEEIKVAVGRPREAKIENRRKWCSTIDQGQRALLQF